MQMQRRRFTRLAVLVGVLAGCAAYAWKTFERLSVEREIKRLELNCQTEAQGFRAFLREVQKGQESRLKDWLREHPSARLSADGVPEKLPTDSSGSPILPPGWKWDDERTTEKRQQPLESCSAAELFYTAYGSDVVLTSTQRKLRDTYHDGIWSGWSASLWSALIVAASAIPWLWYFALDRLRELSAAIQGKSG